MRADRMFENIQAIWVEIRQGDTKYLVSCIHLQTSSATTEYHEKIVDMFECATMTDHPVISLGDFDFNYILDETLSINPIHYIETAYDMHQLIDQQGWMIKPPLCWISFLHPIQYFIVRVQFLNIHPCSKVIGFFCNVEKWYLSSKHRFASLRVALWGVLQQPGKISKYFVWCLCLSEVSKVRKMRC